MPSYLTLYRSGELEDRAARALEMLRACTLCPYRCCANRLDGKAGLCRTGSSAVVSSYGPHFGGEKPLGSAVSAYVEQSCF